MSSSAAVSWNQMGILLTPFTLAYSLLLLPRATFWLPDRYVLGLLVVARLCLVRYYQERVQPRLPVASIVLLGSLAVYSIAVLHNTFAIYRARIALAAEIRSAGIPDTSVDNGWEYNFGVELQHADHLNEETIAVPANAYLPAAPPPTPRCTMNQFIKTPHIRPLYSVSFDPNACYGPAPFSPVHYSRWLASARGTLYVVRSTPPSQP